MPERRLGGRNKGWERALHEAGDNKDEINRVSGLITSKEEEGKEGEGKRLAREEPAPCSTAQPRPPSPHPHTHAPPGAFISRVSRNREGAKYTSEHPPTTTATTLATDGADVF